MKPRTLIEVPRSDPQGLGRTTWEERRKMTAAELIELMGPLHVNHPKYKAKARSLLPIPNIAGLQPVYECKDPSFWALCKSAIRWCAQ